MNTDNVFDETFNNTENIYYRKFKSSLNEYDLLWHFDEEDRYISTDEDTNWCFQFDNELPFLIKKDEVIFIPKNVYHRLINKYHNQSLTLKVIKVV